MKKFFYFVFIICFANQLLAQCPLSNTDFVGDYSLTQVTPNHNANNNIQSFEDQTVVLSKISGTNKRQFSAVYLEALGISQPPTEVSFTLDCQSNSVLVDTGLETGLTCSGSPIITLGPANISGSFNPNDDSNFTLILAEYVDAACGITTPLVTEFTLTKKPCSSPQNINVNDINSSTAIITWDDINGSNTTFDVEYGVSGFTPGNGTMITGLSSPSVTLNNLQTDVIYSFYITTNCTATNTEVTVGPYGISVPEDCDTLFSDFPITENFENIDTFNNCYTTLSEDNNDYSWFLDQFPFGLTTNYFAFSPPDDLPQEDYLFSPPLNMTANNFYNISFVYNAINYQDNDANESLEVIIAQDTTKAAVDSGSSIFTDSTIVQNGDFNSIFTDALKGSETFSPATTGDYYVVFKSTGQPLPQEQSSGFLILFEYDVSEIQFLSTNENNLKEFDYFVDSNNYLNLSANQVFERVKLFSLSGRELFRKKLHKSEEKIDLNQFSSGVYIVQAQINNAFKSFKIIKQ